MLDLAVAVVDGLACDQPWMLVTAQLSECFGGAFVAFHSDLRQVWQGPQVLAWAPEAVGELPLEDRARELSFTHPVAQAFATARDLVPLTVSDVVDSATWRRNPCHEACYVDFEGAVQHLAIPLPPRVIGAVCALVLARAGRDYGERDRELARRLQPVVTSLDRHLVALNRLRGDLARQRSAGTVHAEAARAGLTPRELTVLALLAEGLTAAAVSRRLGISIHTVNKHLENLYRKLGTRDRLKTVLLARQLGLVADQRHGGATGSLVPV